MSWLCDLFLNEGVAHSVMLLAIAITGGIVLGRLKIANISLGITWILFIGIILSHFGYRLDPVTQHFVKEFGLILFVYSIGLQVGPSFFSSFKKGGIRLNMLAMLIVLLGVVTAFVIHLITGVNLTTMVGIMSGAVTNTPGLGAAQQAYTDITGLNDSTLATGYAVAYPLGVIGIIGSIVLVKYMFRVNLSKEYDEVNAGDAVVSQRVAIKISNPGVEHKTIGHISSVIGRPFVVSRILLPDGKVIPATSTYQLVCGDILRVIAKPQDVDSLIIFLGERTEVDANVWDHSQNIDLVSRRVVVTQPNLNGRRIGELNIRSLYGVNITRINRAGIDLVPTYNLPLQMGDRVTVVGSEEKIEKVSNMLGNSMKRLEHPNLIPIFLGIFLGVILGSIPIAFPGIPQPVKLGLAGGPLIVAILISRYGPLYKMVTFTTTSANMMLREVGISLFLAAVGLGAGENFVQTIVDGGYRWILYGFLITIIPTLIVGILARGVYKMNYLKIMGLIAGSTTDPPALAYSNGVAENDAPSVAYATVYPLTMFLRVLVAQLMVLFALS